jgi:hypothetical protein
MDVVKLTSYELWQIDMELAGKWVPCEGETIYIPYDDDADCWSEEWEEGNPTQMEYAEAGLIFPTANEALEKARKDMEAVLYGKGENRSA